MKLPPSHRRSLSVTAALVEESSDELEQLLRARGPRKTASVIEVAYNEADRERLLHALTELRKANEQMIRDLDLQQTVKAEDRIVTASLSHLWTVLADSTSLGLRGFGTLSPDAAQAIDRHIGKMVDLVKGVLP